MAEEEKLVLIRKIKCGDNEAFEQLYNADINLIKSIAKKYFNQGIDNDEVIQYGIIGYYKAIMHFDETKNVKFSTYAYRWIGQSIRRNFFNNDNILRIPINLRDEYEKIKKVRKEYLTKIGFYPTKLELSALTGVSVEHIDRIFEFENKTFSSLDSENKDNNNDKYTFTSSNYSLEDECINTLLRKKLLSMLDENVDEIYKEYVLLKFGFYGEEYSYDKIAKKYMKNKSGVKSQIERSLNKLRKLKETAYLYAYLTNDDIDMKIPEIVKIK